MSSKREMQKWRRRPIRQVQFCVRPVFGFIYIIILIFVVLLIRSQFVVFSFSVVFCNGRRSDAQTQTIVIKINPIITRQTEKNTYSFPIVELKFTFRIVWNVIVIWLSAIDSCTTSTLLHFFFFNCNV